jgi:hypothetical protein
MDDIYFMDMDPTVKGYINWGQLHTTGDYAIVMIPHTAWGDYVGCAACRSNCEILASKWKDWDGVYVIRGDYGSESIGVYMNSLTDEQRDEVKDTIRGLNDYPLIDDEHHSELEQRIEEEDWECYGAGDVVNHLNIEDVADEVMEKLHYVAREHWTIETAVNGSYDLDAIKEEWMNDDIDWAAMEMIHGIKQVESSIQDILFRVAQDAETHDTFRQVTMEVDRRTNVIDDGGRARMRSAGQALPLPPTDMLFEINEFIYELSKRRAMKHGKAIKAGPKQPSRNSPCSCESGLKYKKCCGRDRQLAEQEAMR